VTKVKEITEASASVGLLLATAVIYPTSLALESVVIQETEEADLTSFKEEHSNQKGVSQHVTQSPYLSLHSAKRRHEMIESDSN